MDARKAGAVLSALRAWRAATAASPEEMIETKAFHGWPAKLGEALDEDLGDQEVEEDIVVGRQLIPSIDMVIADTAHMLDSD